jgi:ABC-type lipoprotein release transport system permease subunit
MLLSSIVAACSLLAMNAIGEQFLAITVAAPPAKAPVHLTIQQDLATSGPPLFDSDLIAACSLVQQEPYVTWAQRVGVLETNYAVVGFPENSSFHDQIRLVSGSLSLHANETYVDIHSPHLANYTLGGSVSAPVAYWPQPGSGSWTSLNLTVVGFVDISSALRNIALDNLTIPYGVYGEGGLFPRPEEVHDVFVCSWELTLRPFMESYSSRGYHCSIAGRILVNLRLDQLLGPADVAGSISRLQQVDSGLTNEVVAWGLQVTDYLREALERVLPSASQLSLNAAALSLTTFGLAITINYEAGRTLVDLRRHEFGLLLAKGMTRRRLLRMQLAETLLLTAIATLAGFLLGPLLGALGLLFLGYPLTAGLGFASVPMLALTFGLVFLTLVIPMVLEVRPLLGQPVTSILADGATLPRTSIGHVRRILWLLLILGCYKISGWLVGMPYPSITLTYMFGEVPGLLGAALANLWVDLDLALTPLAPIFFTVGIVGLGIVDSQRIGRAAQTVAQRLFGSLGMIAARDFGRHRQRMGTVVLILVLTTAFLTSATGLLSSESDFQQRNLVTKIGADARLDFRDLTNMSQTLLAVQRLDGVAAATPILAFQIANRTKYGPGWESGDFYEFLAIDAATWLATAYYEPGWFEGGAPEVLVSALRDRNDTVILNPQVATELGVEIGDSFCVVPMSSPNGTMQRMTVVGLVEVTSQYWWRPSLVSWSFVSGLLSWIQLAEPSILVKLEPGVTWQQMEDRIQGLNILNLVSVRFFEQELAAWQTMPLARAFLDFTRITVFACVVLTSVGAIVMLELALSQREADLAMLYIRGMRWQRIRRVLLIEFCAVAWLVLGLGAPIGMLTTYGVISFLNRTFWGFGFVVRRVAILSPSQLILLGCFALFLVSVFLPLLHRRSTFTEKHAHITWEE